MATKKINLKSSINAINAKSSATKKKSLPKLKVILANPYKPKFDSIINDELVQFKKLVSDEIKSSGLSGRLFVKQNNIQLGLGCSLRAIGNKKLSCVIISQSIKPKFIIDQIGCFAKQRNESVLVLVVADWENISAELFGVKSLVVGFPLDMAGVIGKWISMRVQPKKDIKVDDEEVLKTTPPKSNSAVSKNVDLKTLYLAKPSNGARSFVPDIVVKSKPPPKEESKDWTGDFISLSSTTLPEDEPMDMEEIDEEFNRKQEKALEALQRIAKKLPPVETELKFLKRDEPKKEKHEPAKKKVFGLENEEWENDSYVPLEVHKIQPNPNRKPKNKRKKNKKNAINKN